MKTRILTGCLLAGLAFITNCSNPPTTETPPPTTPAPNDSVGTEPDGQAHANYKEHQISCAFSYLAYLGEGTSGSAYHRAVMAYRFIEQGIRMTDVLKNGENPDWKIVWGPIIEISELDYQENFMYVAQQISNPKNFQVAIRGTNFKSVISWFNDISVLELVDWKGPEGYTHGAISDGNNTIFDVLHTYKPPAPDAGGTPLPGSDSTIAEFLTHRALKPGINVTFTGHSLGGGAAPVLGLWFAQSQGIQGWWDPNRHATVNITSFAGPTPGDEKFAKFINHVVTDGRFVRYIDHYDLVPRGWNYSQLSSVEGMYDGTGVNAMTDGEYAAYEALLTAVWAKREEGYVYRHGGDSIKFTFPINFDPLPKGSGGHTFYEQVDYQHVSSYPTYLNVDTVLGIIRHFNK